MKTTVITSIFRMSGIFICSLIIAPARHLLSGVLGMATGVFFFFSIYSAGIFSYGIHIAVAQEGKKSRALGVKKETISGEFNEKKQRELMLSDGVPSDVVDKLIEQRREIWNKGKNIQWLRIGGNNTLPFGPCNGMGVESGWGAWQGQTGTNAPPVTWSALVNPPPPTNANTGFYIRSGAGADPCTPGPAPGAPTIPLVAPGFGNSSIQLGVWQTAGCYAEQITYPINVTIQDTNFVYAYAMVLENPSGHAPAVQPWAGFCMYDATGNIIPCGCFQYVAAPNLPGFYSASCVGAYYKPWTLVGVNLSNYVGQTITAVCTNVDCGYCGHFAQSYWDFLCGTASLSAGCIGNQSTICGPIDPNIAYTYQWYQNGSPIPPPQGTQQCITVTPQPNDTITVEVQQPSGCNFHLGYVPASVQPGFTYSGACGTYTVTNTSTTSPAGVSITGYNWQFPGGTPATANTATATVTYNSPGTYTVTLTITTSAGCSAVTTQIINVTALPQAAFNSSPACLGSAVTLNNNSISPSGDPIVNWSWSIPGGTPASATGITATTLYSTPGTHTVTLTVTTQQGCTSSIPQQVVVYNPPVAIFSGSKSGCLPVCLQYKDSSTSTDGNIVNWNWSFPGGTPSSSTLSNPTVCYYTAGTYGATLTVTTNYGCKSMLTINPTVNVYSWPKANFSILSNNPASAADPTFTFGNLWSSDVVQWSWYFGDGDSNTVSLNPVHSYSSTVTNNDFYTINVCIKVLNQHGCWDTICQEIKIIPDFTFYIPNTFTPNGDLSNELFFGKGRGIKNYNIWIFDRWGNLIWNCDYSGSNVPWDEQGKDGMPSACKWDGKVQKGGADLSGGSGQLTQEDTYVWKVKLTDVFDKKHIYIGHVNVVR